MKGVHIDSPPNTQQQAKELLNDQKLLKKDFQIIEEDYPTPCEEFASFWSGMVTGATTVEKPNANKIATTVRHILDWSQRGRGCMRISLTLPTH